MIRLAHCSVVLALAGCPAKQTTPQASGAGCPPAAGVYFATYVTQERGRSGWVVPLHALKVDAGAEVAPYTNIDAATASASGVPAVSGTLWLATPGAAPCQATLGKYYAAKIEGPPASVSYGIELDGCAATKNPEAGGLVLVSQAAPSGCRFEQPQPIAARVGEVDAQKQWQHPKKETPLPPPLVAAITDRTCAAPACEKLWAFSEVKIDGKTAAWTGALNWLRVGAPADLCSWTAERESGAWIPSGGAAIKVVDGQDHPLPLAAVLADGGGAKVMLADGPGEYITYDLASGRAVLGHHITWQIVPPDAWDAVDRLWPCEPARP